LFPPIFSHLKKWCRKLPSSDKLATVVAVTTKWQHLIPLMSSSCQTLCSEEFLGLNGYQQKDNVKEDFHKQRNKNGS
jgi:hypothetical protein